MTFFDKIYNKLFPSASGENKEAFITEDITRTEQYQRDYFRWVNEGIYKVHLEKIYNAYINKKANVADEYHVHILETPYANGFAFSYHPSLTVRDFNFLFDLFRDQVLNTGYHLKNSGRKIYDRPDYVETKERFYLKPKLKGKNKEQLLDQKYGNIEIENVSIDSKPSYIKLVANVYNDRLYTKALDFNVLLKDLFER